MLWLAIASLYLVRAVPVTRPDPFEHRPSLPSGWVKRQRVEPEAVHKVRIALAMNNLDKGEACLMDVSDPDSPNYGKHWTAQRVAEYFHPSRETAQVVHQWIEETISRPIRPELNRGHLEFTATNSELESLLATEFHYHHHEHDLKRRSVPATHAYYLPEHVRRHVDYVAPGTMLPRSDKRSGIKPPPSFIRRPTSPLDEVGQGSGKACNATAMTPQCIKKLYGIPETPPPVVPGYKHGIYTSGLITWDQQSLDTFFWTQNTGIPNGTHPTSYNIDDAPDPHATSGIESGDEISIDVQISYPIVYPTEIVLLNEGPYEYQKNNAGLQNLMLDALDASYCNYTAYGETGDLPDLGGEVQNRDCGTIDPPKVVMAAWSSEESDMPIAWSRRQCNEYMKLSLQGVSFFYSTGDFGIAIEELKCYGPNADLWQVAWPANCPYVTGVGGTRLKDLTDPTAEQSLYNPNGPTSGGGISSIYDRPSWQKDAVGNYLAKVKLDRPGFSALAPNNVSNPDELIDIIEQFYKTGVSGGEYGYYSTIGRGVPDISALGDVVYNWGYGTHIYWSGGTSASVNVPASIITRINLERMSRGKGSVGWINPVLYKYADRIIRDITDGPSNGGCKSAGFPSAPGWDATTGLGSIKYPEALELFLSLP